MSSPFRIHRYIFLEVLTPFFGGFIFFMFVFLMFQFMRLADYFINHGAGLMILGKMTLYIATAFLPVVLPISFLMATLIGFGRLSSDSEIVALKASGISLLKMYLPVAVLSVLVSAAVLYLTYSYIPWGNAELKKNLVRMGNTKVVSNLKQGTFTEGFFDLLIYADRVDSSTNSLSGVFIFDERDHKNSMAILSQTGQVISLKSRTDLGSKAILRLDRGSIHRPNLLEKSYEKIDFDEYRLMLQVEAPEVDDIRHAKTIPSAVLLTLMKEFEGNYERFREYAIEYWKRIALAFAPMIFGLLGVGLGVVRMRSVRSNAVFIAFAVVVVYWGLHIWSANAAEKQWIQPWLALQIPNLVALPFAIVSFKRSSW